MKSKEDCPKKWVSIFFYTIGICNLYYSFNQYSTLYGVYKEYFEIQHFDFHFNLIMSLQYLTLCAVIIYIGVIVDKYGPGLCFIIQGILITVGQLLICLCIKTKFFFIMYFARILVVIGSSSIAVSKGVYCRDYFVSTHLALTNSITSLSFTVSQIINLNLVWIIFKSHGLISVELFALLLNFSGFLIAFYIYKIDQKNNKLLFLYNFKQKVNKEIQLKSQNNTDIDLTNNHHHLNTEEPGIQQRHIQIDQVQVQDLSEQQQKPQKSLSFLSLYLKDIISLKLSYWLGSITIALSYLSLNTYIVLGPAICQQYLKITPQQSSFYVSFLPNITLIMPIIGKIVDRYKIWFNIYYFISVQAALGTVFLVYQMPTIAFCLIGLAYGSRTSAEFPLICFLVKSKVAGRAYSIARSISMLSISLILFINSFLTQQLGSYFYTLLILLIASLLIIIFITLVKKFKGYEDYDNLKFSYSPIQKSSEDEQSTVKE
ncbi:hypothetical protein ABPG72_009650 [Tetrahymena utriculariae]